MLMSDADKRSLHRSLALVILAMIGLAAAGCQPAASVSQPVASPRTVETAKPRPAFVGSASCRVCHEHFHELWANSRHGLAMQPYTADFANRELSAQKTPITIGQRAFRADLGTGAGVVRETSTAGEKTYPIVHVMGGKNAYYFLTPMDRGRLQVLPVAYDVPKKTWYDTAASGVRHFPDRTDSALDWTDRLFTFNTTCFNCHVSQLATNYDLATDTYRTTWAEAGISCESCHGPAAEHVRVMSEGTVTGHTSKDIQIIRTKEFTSRADERHVRDLPRQDGADVHQLSPRRCLFRPLRPRHLRASRLLARRPRPGRELYVHFLVKEPVRRRRRARLQPLPHRQRPAPLRDGRVQ